MKMLSRKCGVVKRRNFVSCSSFVSLSDVRLDSQEVCQNISYQLRFFGHRLTPLHRVDKVVKIGSCASIPLGLSHHTKVSAQTAVVAAALFLFRIDAPNKSSSHDIVDFSQ